MAAAPGDIALDVPQEVDLELGAVSGGYPSRRARDR